MYKLKNALRIFLIFTFVITCTFVQSSSITNAESVPLAAICGDVNADNVVDSIDYALLKSYLIGKGTLTNNSAADTNSDSAVDAIDLANLKKYLLGLITLPVKPVSNKIIALTFDDGPDITLTPLVLNRLEKYKVPATFMVIGQKLNASTKPVLDRALSLGCEFGNHSWGWDSMSNMTVAQIQKSVGDTTAAIKAYTGTTPNFFRPPNIAVGGNMYSAIDLTFVSGISANDWSTSTTAQQRASAILSAAKDGSIILLHDVQPLPHPTPEALDIIIPTLQSQGYEFVTLTDLFARKGVTLSPTDSRLYTSVP